VYYAGSNFNGFIKFNLGVCSMQHAACSIGIKRHLCNAARSIASNLLQEALVGAMLQLAARSIGVMQFAAFSHWPQEALVSCTMQQLSARGIVVTQPAALSSIAMHHAPCRKWQQDALVSCTRQPTAIGSKPHWCHAAFSNYQQEVLVSGNMQPAD
jgi:hypothetical protein